ncbi:polysaccharide biosynthesis protein [Shewanella piezotolerans]|nr:nucleoside-diphosphate sugar epimerase/dehydratase [Shewanella piezotolerans]
MAALKVLFALKRRNKRIFSVCMDMIFLVFSFWLAMFARLDSFAVLTVPENWLLISAILPISIFAFVRLGLYRAVLRYMGLQALSAIIIGIVIAATSLVILSYYAEWTIPRTVPIIFSFFAFTFIGGSRFLIRSVIGNGNKKQGEAVIIYGAGVSGRQLLTSLNQSHEYHAFAFVDDDESLQGNIIQGVHVHSPTIIRKLIKQKSATKVLLALPSASRSQRQSILKKLEPLAVQILTIPGMSDLVCGKKQYSDIKEVEIDDLLGREAVPPRHELMCSNITNKVVMVTGAGGSIGSEICRQVLKLKPQKLVLFELSEFGLYSIDRELSALALSLDIELEVLPLIGSVQKQNRVQAIMESFGVQTVYHAAAYKHVPLVEYNVVEGVRNNIFGTLYTAKAAIAAHVETFVLISTDKAVRPTNVMGTTKRMAELALQALAKESHRTRFCMVRFGNVLGSSGSVVPLFKSQIAKNGPVTVTHPDITRFFMTIPEASQLVIQAGAMGKGGDVFVLDMGKPIKIVDLAVKMIHLSGFTVKDDQNPDGDIEVSYAGLRPGEKLYEELLIGDDVVGTEHERIMAANELSLPWSQYSMILSRLDHACHRHDHQEIREILLSTPTGFVPKDGICDLVFKQSTLNKFNSEKIVSLLA